MSNLQEADFGRIIRGLERRYPGVTVQIVTLPDWADDKGWDVMFSAENQELLIQHGLADGSMFEREYVDKRRPRRVFELAGVRIFGVSTSKLAIVDYQIMESSQTCPVGLRTTSKKMQTQVMRLLKPFIRGTWKPATVRP